MFHIHFPDLINPNCSYLMLFNAAVTSLRSCRKVCCSFLACLVCKPLINLEFRQRSKPSGVFGPVDLPPCKRQRALAMAGCLQGFPVRLLLAPHRGAL